MFSSEETEWQTPPEIFDPISAYFGGFTLDAAASQANHLVPVYYSMDGLMKQHFSTPNRVRSVEGDGLSGSWAVDGYGHLPTTETAIMGAKVWCNPPYSRETKEHPGIDSWVKKAATEVRRGGVEVAALLLPARTEVQWFQNWVAPYATVVFITGRVRFIGPDGKRQSSAPFPSLIAVYRPDFHVKPGQLDSRLWDPRTSDFEL